MCDEMSRGEMSRGEMRRGDRAMLDTRAWELLERGEYGVLSTVGADGRPYAVPLSYAVIGGEIYFHCAREGRKLRDIAYNPLVCFCVVGKTRPVYKGAFSTFYESVIVQGTAFPVSDDAAKTAALTVLAAKYLPEHMDKAPGDIASAIGITAVYRIAVDRITGKEHQEA